MKFLIGFFGWPLFIWLEVRRNYVLIEKEKEKPNYLHSFFFRSFFGLVCLCLMAPYFDPVFLWSWFQAWPYIVFELSLFYLTFDVWLNLKRDLPWNYRGRKSGWLDRSPEWAYYSLKLLSLAGLIVSLKTIL